MNDVDWGQVAILVAVLVPSVILHEVSHGFVANLFGDDTAKRAGRLTLNPLRHIDPFGTVFLPLLLSLSGVGAFGYAKPVPVAVNRLRNPRQHSLYVSLAGPLVNITLSLLAIVVLRLWYGGELLDLAVRFAAPEILPTAARVVFWAGVINLILAVFNLLPIPPLDGSAFVERVLPTRWWPTWLKYRQYGFGVVLLLVFVVPGGLDFLFEPAIDGWLALL